MMSGLSMMVNARYVKRELNTIKLKNQLAPSIWSMCASRNSHPVLKKIYQAKLNSDEGTVIKFQEKLFQGKNALHMMAMLGSDEDILNRIHNNLFRSKFLATTLYPFMRAA